MDYKQKTLKYKLKYLKLKNQIGGEFEIIEKHFPELLDKLDIKTLRKISLLLKDLPKNMDIINFIISDKINLIERHSKYYIELISKSLTHKNLNKLYNLFRTPYVSKIDTIIKQIKNEIMYNKFRIVSDKPIYNTKTFIINAYRKNEWITRQKPKDARILANFIINITKHVSFQEFQDKLLESIKKIPTDKKYVIVIPNITEKKSNKWISALLIDLIEKHKLNLIIMDVISNKNIGLIYLYSLYEEYVDFIICDDGSYSGGQITTDMQEIFNNTSSLSKIKTYCLLPFTSTFAESRIKKLENVILLNSDKIESIRERCQLLEIDSLELTDRTLCIENDDDYNEIGLLLNKYFPNIRNNYKYELLRGNMPFYFDHKIADFVSSFPVIYQYGIIESEGKNILLFDNCDFKTTKDGLNEVNFYEQCVIPYYKTLNIEIQEYIVSTHYSYLDVIKNVFSSK
jgi:hypothetical protein